MQRTFVKRFRAKRAMLTMADTQLSHAETALLEAYVRWAMKRIMPRHHCAKCMLIVRSLPRHNRRHHR